MSLLDTASATAVLGELVSWLSKEETARTVVLVGGKRGRAVPHTGSLPRPKEAARGRGDAKMSGKKCPWSSPGDTARSQLWQAASGRLQEVSNGP